MKRHVPLLKFVSATFLLVVLLTSCKKEALGPTYISGKIINPHDNYVIIKNYQDLSDTIMLSSDGSFFKKYDYLDPGLYTIIHPNEYQSIYLAPNDSIVLRLNTKAFDESLAFSGSHSRENNYLIELFNRIETQDDLLWSKYKQLNHRDFKAYIDSIEQQELTNLTKENEKHQLDTNFNEHARQTIAFMTGAIIERYAYAHYGRNDYLLSAEIPEDFYSHRKSLPIDDTSMLNNYAYRPYANALISSLSFKRNAKQLGSGSLVKTRSLEYYNNRLQVIDSIFSSSEIKDMYAASTARNFITNRENSKDINQLLQLFNQIVVDDSIKNDVNKIAATYMSLEPGNKMPDIKLQNTSKEKILLSQRLNKLSVLFFWSEDDTEYALKVHERIKELRLKYPAIDFIGINLDDSTSDNWIAANDRYQFDVNQEFQILNTSPVTSKLALRNRNRTMVIDSNLTIIDPSINLFHYQIENTLLGYINR